MSMHDLYLFSQTIFIFCELLAIQGFPLRDFEQGNCVTGQGLGLSETIVADFMKVEYVTEYYVMSRPR